MEVVTMRREISILCVKGRKAFLHCYFHRWCFQNCTENPVCSLSSSAKLIPTPPEIIRDSLRKSFATLLSLSPQQQNNILTTAQNEMHTLGLIEKGRVV